MTEIDAALPADPIEPEHPVPRWGPAAIAAFVGLVALGYVATVVAPSWANEHPVGLLALNSRVRHLLLALGGEIGVVPYVVVAGLRLTVAYVVCHMIGRAYGRKILEVFGRYLGVTHHQVDAIFESFGKVEWFVVPFFVGSNLVAAITGIERMKPAKLAVYLVIGIAGRLALYYWLSKVFDDEIDKVLDFLKRYTRPMLLASVVMVIGVIGLNVRRGRSF